MHRGGDTCQGPAEGKQRNRSFSLEALLSSMFLIMKGVRFVVDEAGQKTDVIINLKENPELWEDLYDRSLARKLAARTSRRAHG